MYLTPFLKRLKTAISERGGAFNGHLHLDRADTASNEAVTIMTLQQKHMSIEEIHKSGLYSLDKIAERVLPYVEFMGEIETARADTFVDVTRSIGLAAISAMQEFKKLASFDLRIGAYCPLGFEGGDLYFDKMFETAVESADFIGGLPERDEKEAYPSHIGFENSCLKVLSIGAKYNKPVHIHVDQKNIPGEGGVQRVLGVVESMGSLPPEVWLIHAISLSAETDDVFYPVCERLINAGVGIICCPSAALSMKQERGRLAPIHNSIARVVDMVRAGIKVRVGSDNVTDMFLPATAPDIFFELLTLANAERCYDIEILSQIGSMAAAKK